MFFHLVLIKTKPSTDEDFGERVETFAKRVREECQGIEKYAFTSNTASRAQGYEWAAYGLFASGEDHDKYQASSAHQEMKAYIGAFAEHMVVCETEWK